MYSLSGVLVVCLLACATVADDCCDQKECCVKQDFKSLTGQRWKIISWTSGGTAFTRYLTNSRMMVLFFRPMMECDVRSNEVTLKVLATGPFCERLSNTLRSIASARCGDYETFFFNPRDYSYLAPSMTLIGTDGKKWAVVLNIEPPSARPNVWIMKSDCCKDLCECRDQILEALYQTGLRLEDMEAPRGVSPNPYTWDGACYCNSCCGKTLGGCRPGCSSPALLGTGCCAPLYQPGCSYTTYTSGPCSCLKGGYSKPLC